MPDEVIMCACGNKMQKASVMNSGNCNYNVFKCSGCNKQVMRAIGVGK